MSIEPDATITDGRTPPAEVEVDEPLVRRLLAAQHADLTDLPLRYVTDGWDNVTWRLGDDLAVRLPRREVAVGLLRAEQRWLPTVAARVGVAVPEPVRRGEAGEGFPWPWSVVRWVPGTPVDEQPLDAGEAAVFGRFLADLHAPAPEELPASRVRGVPLATRAPFVEIRWDRLETLDIGLAVGIHEVRGVWAGAVDQPIDAGPVWLHGDLHPKNLVGDGGRLVGVIDWGDLGAGDPATDLAGAWMLFPPEAHDEVWSAYGDPSDATLARARGWAVYFGTVLLDTDVHGEDTFGRIGRATLERAVAG